MNTPTRVAQTIEYLSLFGLCLLYWVLKSYALQPSSGDENIYFYMLSLMRDGVMPYRDFFFAHPPLHLFSVYPLLLLGAPIDLTLGKLIPINASFISLLAVYFIARKLWGRLPAFLSAALFLGSHDILRASSHFTGVNIAVTFLCLGLLASVYERDKTAGVLFACGALSGFYITPLFLALFLIFFIGDSKRAKHFGLSFMAVFCFINLAFLLWARAGYFDPVYRYHLLKPSIGSSSGEVFNKVVFNNFYLFFYPVLGLLLSAFSVSATSFYSVKNVSSSDSFGSFKRYILLSFAYLVFLCMLGKLFHYYFVPLLALLSLCSGYAVSAYLIKPLWSFSKSPKSKRLASSSLVFIVALVVAEFLHRDIEKKFSYYEKRVGVSRPYTWNPSPFGSGVDSIIRAIWWPEEGRVIGNRYTGIHYYLWHESRNFLEAHAIAEYVREHSNREDTIFGYSATAPLIALLSDRKIEENFIDTNSMRFVSKITPIEDAIAAIKRPGLRFLVLTPRSGIFSNKKFRAAVQKAFRRAKRFPTKYFGSVDLYEKK